MTVPMADPPSGSSEPEKPTAFSIVANVLPVLHLGGSAVVTGLAFESWAARIAAGSALLYLLPPLAVRLSFAVFGRPSGRLRQTDVAYRVWWLSVQWQMVFLRLPALEEVLRLVPGLYAAWIALWGGRLSPRAFVAAGVRILDRPLVEVEAGAVLGFSATLSGHAGLREPDGSWVVVVAPARVEADALLGAGSGVGPGAVVRRGTVLPIAKRLGPGGVWPRPERDGRGEESK